ncbi:MULTISPECIES: alpha/beta hydrolase [unclassified Streptomyces]|uniref:alpha/beta hydrolase n=1 Tax=unclassified Streptomyces TaxID=2593676 RepID=UPI00224CC7C8|nr:MULTISPECIES: alpha/beta hydrolase [unclassified Streptomyces]MCX5144461.1 alpha/beta hydrolase family protein [Streptomyces sp. NBC_00338]WRZ68825.1 alpha/beta hydrolase family protein [Streptomyces sp. NBC_01257]
MALRTRSGRTRRGRLRRALLAALVAASVAVPLSGAASPAHVPAPAPTVSGPPAAATPAALAERYAASRRDIGAAGHMAAAHGDHRRADALRVMARPARRFLSFDGREGGRTVEVVGDLARAERIAVLVPGAGVLVDNYWRLLGGARALHKELGDRSAVVAWLGYETPATVSAAAVTSGRAEDAAHELRRFLGELKTLKPAARTSLVCHSYGSVVCARAASAPGLADVVLYGSPGTGYDNAAALKTRATVWTGRSSGDWIADVPHLKVPLLVTEIGFGTDPVSEEFGARRFPAGDVGHSDYLKPGSVPLRNIARIVSGQDLGFPSESTSGGRHA